MGIASLKPYNMIGVQNKLNRLYGRKLSLRGQFSFATRFLKEKGKESIYEKPYLDLSRPEMHQSPPTPDWPSDPPPPPWQFPPSDPKYHIYIFAPGIVSLFIHGPAECEGDPVPGNATVSLQAQHSEGSQNVWKFKSSDERVRVIDESYWPPWSETSVDFNVEVDWDNIDEEIEVEMCASVMLRGDLVRKIAVPMFEGRPLPGWEGTPQEPPTVVSLPLEIWTDYVYPTECTELIVEGCCDDTQIAWDTSTSPETIDEVAVVAILDPLESGMPYSWAVSGTGFTLDNSETEGLSNTLRAGSGACGIATITVTGCDGKVVTGYVRSLAGEWVAKGVWRIVDFPLYSLCEWHELILGEYRYNEAYCCAWSVDCPCAPCTWEFDDQCCPSTAEEGDFSTSPNQLAQCEVRGHCMSTQYEITDNWTVQKWECE